MYFITILAIGISVGVLARLFTADAPSPSIFGTILLGLTGALLVGEIGRALGWFQTPFQLTGVVGSSVGAMIAVRVGRALIHRTPAAK